MEYFCISGICVKTKSSDRLNNILRIKWKQENFSFVNLYDDNEISFFNKYYLQNQKFIQSRYSKRKKIFPLFTHNIEIPISLLLSSFFLSHFSTPYLQTSYLYPVSPF